MKRFDVIRDASELSNISISRPKKFISNIVHTISEDVHETILDNDNVCILDIGIGTLSIDCNKDNLRYKFIPTKHLENSIVSGIVSDGTLVKKLEKDLTNTFLDIYEESV